MNLDKEALAINLAYKLEQVSQKEWERFYIGTSQVLKFIEDNDYNHFDNMIENVEIATKEAKVDMTRFIRRLAQGLSVEDALSKKELQQDRLAMIPVEYDGVQYEDIRDMMRQHNTKRSDVIGKMKKHKIPLKGALFLIKAENKEKATLQQMSTPVGANESAVKKRKASGWPEKFWPYLYFSQSDIIELSDAMNINAANVAVMKNSGYTLEWTVSKLVENRDVIEQIDDEEFTRRIMSDWDFELACQVLEPISINGQKFTTPVDALHHFCENFEQATISFIRGVELFDIIGIKDPLFIKESNAYFTSVDDFARAYGFEKGNVIALRKTGSTFNDISMLKPKDIYRVGGFCFTGFESACEYFQLDESIAREALSKDDSTRYEVFTSLGNAHKTLLSAVM